MKCFFTSSFIALALMTAAGAYVPTAHAEEFFDAFGNSFPTQSAASASDAKSSAASAAAPSPATTGTGANIPSELPTKAPNDYSYNSIMIWIMTLFAWLFGVAAILLDNAVYYTVVTMGQYVNQLSAIGIVWTTLRDIANIILIFGFLAAGIMTILNTEQYGWGSKMIPTLLIGAVLINFSLFFSEAIIDGGNLFATQFYKQINGGQLSGAKLFTPSDINNEPISNAIWNKLGLQTIYGAVKNPSEGKNILENSWTIGFMASGVFLVAAFVMFSLALTLIARFVILIFLIITSPIGIVGWVIPKLQKFGSDWWSQLIQQTITAPVLLLLLYVALRVITSDNFLIGKKTSSAGSVWTGFVDAKNLEGFAGILLSFLVAMGLLLAVVAASHKLGAFGAGWATKTAGKLTFGATAMASRSTVGWGATKTGKLLGRTRLARVPFVGTGIIKGLDRAGKSSFDVRGTNALKSFPMGGIDAGKAQKGGYQATLKEQIKKREEYAENLITGKDLSDDEKKEQARIEAEIQVQKKKIANARDPQDILDEQAAMRVLEKKKEDFENRVGTKAANQRRYANVLNLGEKPNAVLNFFNPASNTEAAKSIKDKAKKGKVDKDMAATFKKLIEDNAAEAGGGATPATPPPGGAPAAGPAAGPATPPPATPPPGPTPP